MLVLDRGLLLSLLGGRNHFVGGCRRSWAAGIVCGGGTCVTFHGGDVVAGRMWVGFGQCVELSLVRGGCWLKKPRHKFVTLASSTFYSHVKSTTSCRVLFGHILNHCYCKLVIQTHLFASIQSLAYF